MSASARLLLTAIHLQVDCFSTSERLLSIFNRLLLAGSGCKILARKGAAHAEHFCAIGKQFPIVQKTCRILERIRQVMLTLQLDNACRSEHDLSDDRRTYIGTNEGEKRYDHNRNPLFLEGVQIFTEGDTGVSEDRST